MTPFLRKYKTAVISILARMKNYSGFHFAALTDFFKNYLRQNFCIVPMLTMEALLRNRKQRIKVSFFRNQFVERACFNNGTVLQSDNAIVLF